MSSPQPIHGPLALWGEIRLLDDLEKATATPKPRRPHDRFAGTIGGWMSLSTKDREGDVIDVDAIDASMLLSDGWFNDNHSKATTAVVGYPTLAEIRKHPKYGRAWWIEGVILDDAAGQALVAKIRALEGTDRQFGFSVEGPPPLRDPTDPHKVVKAWVWNVAITNRPVHEQARIEWVKSLEPLGEYEQALAEFCAFHPVAGRVLWKALTAGTPTPNTATGGGALQREFLVPPVRASQATAESDSKIARKLERLRKRRSPNRITEEEAAARVHARFPQIPLAKALEFVRSAESIRA